MQTIGIDIGTTTVSGVLLAADGTQLQTRSVRHGAALPSEGGVQAAACLLSCAAAVLEELLSCAEGAVGGIGITGQMHGIVFLDGTLAPCSPLYTWQDGRASAALCREIRDRTGYAVSPGYGLATAIALTRTDEIPMDAVVLCTIMDAFAAFLTGNPPVMHTTNAAGLGFYRLFGDGGFDAAAFSAMGGNAALLPCVTDTLAAVGTYRGIPVFVGTGDNQASFAGTVADVDTGLLANFGTGSQISLCVSCAAAEAFAPQAAQYAIELRPYFDGRYLLCGAALCGGKAYAILERFFRTYSGGTEQYECMNRLAAQALDGRQQLPCVVPTFCGTRIDASVSASVTGLNEETFTPGALIAGTLVGMAEELHAFYRHMPHGARSVLYASGNAARKNPALLHALERVFGMNVMLPPGTEEAACGAARLAGVALNNQIGEEITK